MNNQIRTKNGVIIYEIVGQRPNHTYYGEFENIELLMDQNGNVIDIEIGNLSGLLKPLNDKEINKVENLTAKLDSTLKRALPENHIFILKLQ